MPAPDMASYSYSSSPKPIKPRKKAAAEEEDAMPINIMADPRVFRGSMYSIARAIEQEQQQELVQQKQSAQQNASKAMPVPEQPKPWYEFTSPSYSGAVDVSSYLVEQPRASVVTAAESQTDPFRGQPEAAPYIPRKTGIDASTTIEDQTELFVFDEEVKPLLEILVQKTLEQAQYELECEAELAAIEQAMEEHQQRRQAEAAQIRQREEETIKEFDRLQAAKKSEQERVQLQMTASRKLACVQCARFLYNSGLKDALSNIHMSGVWNKPQRDTTGEFITEEVLHNAQATYSRQVAARVLIQELLENAAGVFASRRPDRWLQHEPSTLLLRINLKLPSGGSQVGSIELNAEDTVEIAEQRIREYITSSGLDIPEPDGGYLSSALSKDLISTCQISEISIPDALELAL